MGSNKVRSDRRCGADFPLDDGKASECDGEGPNYCCSKFGYCGPGAAHCDGGVDYRPASALKVKSVSNGKVRGDRRCGSEFPADDGEPGSATETAPTLAAQSGGTVDPVLTTAHAQDARISDPKIDCRMTLLVK